MKRKLVIIICMLLLLLPLTACGTGEIVFRSSYAEPYSTAVRPEVFETAVVRSVRDLKKHVLQTRLGGMNTPYNIYDYDDEFFLENYLALKIVECTSSGSHYLKSTDYDKAEKTYIINIKNKNSEYQSCDIIHKIFICELPNKINAETVIFSLI